MKVPTCALMFIVHYTPPTPPPAHIWIRFIGTSTLYTLQ